MKQMERRDGGRRESWGEETRKTNGGEQISTAVNSLVRSQQQRVCFVSSSFYSLVEQIKSLLSCFVIPSGSCRSITAWPDMSFTEVEFSI